MKYFILILLTTSFLFSCESDDNDELIEVLEGGFVTINNPFVRYIVDSDSTVVSNDSIFTVIGSVLQGNSQTSMITINKTFTNAVTGTVSDQILLTSSNITNAEIDSISSFEFSFNYENLISGITIDNTPLPDNDIELNVGDYWTFTYSSHTKFGTTVNNIFSIVAVEHQKEEAPEEEALPYEGIYTTLESEYWKKGALQSTNWVGRDRIIEGVSDGVYRHVGLATWDDNEFFFTVDEATGVITVLDVDLDGNPQLLNGSPIMTCEGVGFPFEYITCDATTSVAIPDPVNGKHELKFTVGYSKSSGQNRELFEHLVKK